VSALRSLARRGQTLPFMIMVDGVLAGQVTVGNVLRGSLRSAWVGYWVDSEVTAAAWPPPPPRWSSTTASATRAARVEATVRPRTPPACGC